MGASSRDLTGCRAARRGPPGRGLKPVKSTIRTRKEKARRPRSSFVLPQSSKPDPEAGGDGLIAGVPGMQDGIVIGVQKQVVLRSHGYTGTGGHDIAARLHASRHE